MLPTHRQGHLLEPETFPPLWDTFGELAIFAARSFDMPFS
jgi:hypothetical protein